MFTRKLLFAALFVLAGTPMAHPLSIWEIEDTGDVLARMCSDNRPIRAADCIEDLRHLYHEWKQGVRTNRLSSVSLFLMNQSLDDAELWRRIMERVRNLNVAVRHWEQRYELHIIARPGQR